jgi:hypothetical protein
MSSFTLLHLSLPDVARLLIAMVQARDAVESRSWPHPQEPTAALKQDGHHSGHEQQDGNAGERESARARNGRHPPHPFASAHL